MIKQKLFFLLCCASLFFVACEKKVEFEKTKLVSRIVELRENGQGTIEFEYDNQNRLTKMNVGYVFFQYSYSGNTVTTTMDGKDPKIIANLNNKNYITGGRIENEIGDRTSYTNWNVDYTNDLPSKITLNTIEEETVENVFTWSEDKKTLNISDSDSGSTYQYQYGNKKNKNNVQVAYLLELPENVATNPFMPYHFYGKTNEYLITKLVYTNSVATDEYHFQYTFDADGYITIVAIVENYKNDDEIDFTTRKTYTLQFEYK